MNQANETTNFPKNSKQQKAIKKSTFSDFNFIAPYYDFLQKLVFGNALQKAQSFYLKDFPDSKKVLIIGGGSGEILKSISDVLNSDRVVFVEQSENMIAKAKKRKVDIKDLDFVCENVLEWKSTEKFDLVILPFILDCFSTDTTIQLLQNLKDILAENGRVLFTDFVQTPNKRGLSKLLISVMYFFFGMTAKLKTRKLPDFDLAFERAGYENIKKNYFVKQLVQSRVYKINIME